MYYTGFTFIVRNFDANGKFAINTRNLIDALRKLDELRAAGTDCDIVCKNKASRSQQICPLGKDWIEKARAQM